MPDPLIPLAFEALTQPNSLVKRKKFKYAPAVFKERSKMPIYRADMEVREVKEDNSGKEKDVKLADVFSSTTTSPLHLESSASVINRVVYSILIFCIIFSLIIL